MLPPIFSPFIPMVELELVPDICIFILLPLAHPTFYQEHVLEDSEVLIRSIAYVETYTRAVSWHS